jgi:hypothetical protein
VKQSLIVPEAIAFDFCEIVVSNQTLDKGKMSRSTMPNNLRNLQLHRINEEGTNQGTAMLDGEGISNQNSYSLDFVKRR